MMWKLLLGVLVILSSIPVSAQTDLPETLITEARTFQVRYPRGWEAREREDGGILLSGDEAIVLIIPPPILERGKLLPAETATDLLDEYIARNEGSMEFDEPQPIEELNAVRADFTTDNESLDFMTSAFVMVLETGDTFTLLLVSGQDIELDDLETFAFDIARSIEIGSFAQPGDVSGDLPTLEQYTTEDMNDQWVNAIAELETLGLVPEDGTLLLDEEILFRAFSGGFRVDEESATPHADFVMAGLISLRPVNEGDFVFCGLITRATIPGSEADGDFLMVGPTSDGEVVALEVEAASQNANLIRRDSPVDFHHPQHVLYIAKDQQVTVFINGEALIENWPLNLPAEANEAAYETLYAGTNLDLGCVMTSVWAYSFASE